MGKRRQNGPSISVLARLIVACALVFAGAAITLGWRWLHAPPVPQLPHDLGLKVHGQHEPGQHWVHGSESSEQPTVRRQGVSVDGSVRGALLHLNAASDNSMPASLLTELGNRSAVSFVVSKQGESCHKACGAIEECKLPWFPFINECSILMQVFPEARTCATYHFGRDLPALRIATGTAMVNSKPDDYPTSCDSEYASGQRLCACGPKQAQLSSSEVTPKVIPGIITRLKEIAAADRTRESSPGHEVSFLEGHSWGSHTGGPGVEDLLEDLQEDRVRFYTGEPNESCYSVCKARGNLCLRHWFETVNTCSILSDAFPSSVRCEQRSYGRDLPAYRPATRAVLVNSDTRTYAPACTAHSWLLSKLCPCGYHKGGTDTSMTFHTVYNVQASHYFEWQVRYMKLWAEQVEQPGKVTRLLSATKMDHLKDIPTHVSASYDFRKDHYVPYNKPLSVSQWLATGQVVEDVIIIIDPDCCFVHKVDIMVQEGAPVAQPAFYSFDVNKPNSVPNQIARRYCPKCAFVDPIAVPIIVHRRDIEKIAPLWLSKTEQMRKEKDTWPNAWSNASLSPITLGWTAEMFGYVFAAAELGIRHEIHDLQVVAPVHKRLAAPFIHYHVAVPVGNRKWHKANVDAATNIPWPLSPDIDEVTAMLITRLHNASVTLPPTGHEWTQSYYQPMV